MIHSSRYSSNMNQFRASSKTDINYSIRKQISRYTYICCVIVTSCRVLEGIWHKVVLRTLINVKPTEWNIHNHHTSRQHSNSQQLTEQSWTVHRLLHSMTHHVSRPAIIMKLYQPITMSDTTCSANVYILKQSCITSAYTTAECLTMQSIVIQFTSPQFKVKAMNEK